jgi:hypothetical protein
MPKKFTNEIETACKTIANAAELATKAIAGAAEQAKVLIATDAAKAVKIEEKRTNGNGFMDILYKQISLGMSILSVFGLVLGIFIYITGPTKDNDTALQLQDQRITAQRTTIDELTKTAQNDTKELKSEIVGLRTEVQTATNKIVELSTIINERIPAKK